LQVVIDSTGTKALDSNLLTADKTIFANNKVYFYDHAPTPTVTEVSDDYSLLFDRTNVLYYDEDEFVDESDEKIILNVKTAQVWEKGTLFFAPKVITSSTALLWSGAVHQTSIFGTVGTSVPGSPEVGDYFLKTNSTTASANVIEEGAANSLYRFTGTGTGLGWKNQTTLADGTIFVDSAIADI
jgi:hypothetical protein